MRISFVFGVLGATILLTPADRPGPHAAQQPSLTFTRVMTEPPATDRASTGGVSWVDFDADGDVDLFVGNGYDVSANTAVPQANRLYENRGGRFVPLGGEGPLWEDSGFSSGSAWADFDNDGHVDVFVPNQRNQPNFLYRNAGVGFRRVDAPPVTSDEGLAFSATWADVDRDGWVDLFVSNGGLSAPRHNALYRNLDGKTFEARGAQGVTADSIQTGGATFVDVDLDGDQDLFVPGRESRLYRNDGDFQFTTQSRVLFATEPPLLSMALAGTWGDYDNDGDFDLYLGMYLGETNRLYVNQGDLQFVRGSADLATLDGSPTVDVDWADLDNNGWLDLVVTNWGAPVHVYLQTDGRFERVVLGDLGRHMGYGSGAAVADYDNDGDLDLIVGHWPNHPGPEEENHLYRNDGPVGNWLRLDLHGTVSNRSAIGARIEVEVLEATHRRTMTREIRSQESWRGQNELTAHFGLGTATAASSITVHWPSGKVQRVGETEANQRVALTEPN